MAETGAVVVNESEVELLFDPTVLAVVLKTNVIAVVEVEVGVTFELDASLILGAVTSIVLRSELLTVVEIGVFVVNDTAVELLLDPGVLAVVFKTEFVDMVEVERDV